MLSTQDIKQQLGIHAATLIKEGMTIGAGTGTTAYWFIVTLAERIKEGLSVKVVPTSRETENLLLQHDVPVQSLNDTETIDLVIDGADEIDPQFNCIKGGGAALLQEKMVAAAASQLIILADESKLVEQLGKFPLPVEVIPFGYEAIKRKLEKETGKLVTVRLNADAKPLLTDHGHYILDLHCVVIDDPAAMEIYLNMIPGVVENGLFINRATASLIGYKNGDIKYHSKK